MRIYLTGFMGSGKSYTGKLLAEKLGLNFVDLDTKIEAAAGRTVSEIFATSGEEAFRKLEAEALRDNETEGAVVATGGGAPCFHRNMEYMNEAGLTVFLDPSLDILVQRLEAGRDHRPLLQQEETLQTIIEKKLAARRPIYEQAQVQVTYDDPQFDVVAFLTKLR